MIQADTAVTQRAPAPALRLLVVDDEPGVLMTLVANLELEGFEVLEASDPRRALEIAEEAEFDVLVTDVRMPGMNGVELFQKLKEKKPDLCAIVMTAFAAEDVLDDGLQQGVYTVLRKPFDIAQLTRLANRAARNGVVMVIDDKPELGQSLTAALETAGIPAVSVRNSAEALAQIADGAVDSCIVDLVMPGMDGAALCNALRAVDRDVTLVTMTGYNVPELVVDANRAGSYACLRKPFDVDVLVRTLARARRG